MILILYYRKAYMNQSNHLKRLGWNSSIVFNIVMRSEDHRDVMENTTTNNPEDEFLHLQNKVLYTDTLYCDLHDNSLWYKPLHSLDQYNYTPTSYWFAQPSLHLLSINTTRSHLSYNNTAIVLVRYVTNIFHFAEVANNLLHFFLSSAPIVCCIIIILP